VPQRLRIGAEENPQRAKWTFRPPQGPGQADVIWTMGGMRNGTRDFYEVLGVPRDAGGEAIKRAFRTCARECHPDVATAPGASERFRELANAYDVLSLPQSRRLYDRFGYRGPGNGGFEALSDIVAELELEPHEAARGTARRVRFVRFDACPDCAGSGSVACRTCADCGGVGKVTTKRTVEVVVPPGAEDGQALYLPADDGRVLVRVLPLPADSSLVRHGAAAGLLAALAFLALLLTNPHAAPI